MKKTVCFTGHRVITMPLQKMQEELFIQIQSAICMGYTHFICGGAIGFDILAAERVIYTRDKYNPEITLEIAVPCKDQDLKWSQEQKTRYKSILEKANQVTMVSNQGYTPQCMRLRNEYMIDNSDIVIAYFNDKPSGTKNTIRYAQQKGKEIRFIQ